MLAEKKLNQGHFNLIQESTMLLQIFSYIMTCFSIITATTVEAVMHLSEGGDLVESVYKHKYINWQF